MGIVAATLTSLLSGLRRPGLDAPSKNAVQKSNNQIIATVVSLVTTVLAFGVTMIGAGDSLRGLKTIVNRISAAGQAINARMSAHGACIEPSDQEVTQ
jgi:alpha-D-ribose 1-methylphosphonate 5-triphosphate diphosphatase PhnM